MKKKIKLRDITEEQYKKWKEQNCCNEKCDTCPFFRVECMTPLSCWVKNKELYSDKFLNQEVEIEVPELLTPKEKEYLEGVIRPFKDKVKDIVKVMGQITLKEFIYIQLATGETIDLPYFERKKYYKKLKLCKHYTIEELGLFKE